MKVVEIQEGDDVPEEVNAALQEMRKQAAEHFVGEMRKIAGLEHFELCQLNPPVETVQ